MNIDKILKLGESGFNVPVHVLDAWQKYKGETLPTLKAYVFPSLSSVHLLADRGLAKEKSFVSLPLSEAVLIMAALTKAGYRTLVMEDPPVEWSGSIIWDRDKCRGRFCQESEEMRGFSFPENLESARDRFIVRTCQKAVEALGANWAEIRFWWSTKFLGVNAAKLIIYDYNIFEFSLDK